MAFLHPNQILWKLKHNHSFLVSCNNSTIRLICKCFSNPLFKELFQASLAQISLFSQRYQHFNPTTSFMVSSNLVWAKLIHSAHLQTNLQYFPKIHQIHFLVWHNKPLLNNHQFRSPKTTKLFPVACIMDHKVVQGVKRATLSMTRCTNLLKYPVKYCFDTDMKTCKDIKQVSYPVSLMSRLKYQCKMSKVLFWIIQYWLHIRTSILILLLNIIFRTSNTKSNNRLN